MKIKFSYPTRITLVCSPLVLCAAINYIRSIIMERCGLVGKHTDFLRSKKVIIDRLIKQ